MFKGEFTHSIDAKGRIIIPAKYREALGLKFVVAEGHDNCLYIYTTERWEKFDEIFNKMPQSDPKVRRYIRKFYGGAVDLEPDNNGRVMIPAKLKEYAGLKKDVITVGANDHLEIWDVDSYNNYWNDSDFTDDDMQAAMAAYGL